MLKMLRKKRVKNLIYSRFVEYQKKGDWHMAGLYAEKYYKHYIKR